ncbi:MAG: trigger factor [Acidimicrobiia bacterium]
MTVREVGPFERLVVVNLSDADIDAAKSAAARRLSKDLKLAGFRPGKAPRPVVEAAVGSARLRSEAIDDLIPQRLQSILENEDLSPVVNPHLESMNEVDGGVEAEVRVTLWPALETVPDFRGREIVVSSPELTEDDVHESIERMRNQFAALETVDRPAGHGDFVSVDITATEGETALAETNAEELLYEVGSGLLVEGSDEELLGKSAGDVVTFMSKLPEGFGERAGIEAWFTIKVNEVKSKVLPNVDDEWVQEVTEFESVDELEAELRLRLARTKRLAAARELRATALDLLADETQVEIPEPLLRAEMADLLHRFSHRLESNDITLQDYMEATGIDGPDLEADLRSQAEKSLKTRLALEAVAKAEGIEVTPEELTAEINALATMSDDPEGVIKAMTEGARALSMAGDILRNKALAAVLGGAKTVDAEGNPVELGTEMAEIAEVEALPLEEEVVEAEIVAEEA